MATLKSIDLENNDLKDQGLVHIMEGLAKGKCQLDTLNMSQNHLQLAGKMSAVQHMFE